MHTFVHDTTIHVPKISLDLHIKSIFSVQLRAYSWSQAEYSICGISCLSLSKARRQRKASNPSHIPSQWFSCAMTVFNMQTSMFCELWARHYVFLIWHYISYAYISFLFAAVEYAVLSRNWFAFCGCPSLKTSSSFLFLSLLLFDQRSGAAFLMQVEQRYSECTGARYLPSPWLFLPSFLSFFLSFFLSSFTKLPLHFD